METLALWGTHGIKVALFLAVAALLARLLALIVSSRFGEHMGGAHALLLTRALGGTIWGIALLLVLHELGINLSVLLGAAGIATVALGFAAQTSASNLISGVFLLGDRAFSIGDVIKLEGTQGEVIAVDQLSIKLRTPDNLMVRIPNETLIKASITNMTRWPIRRLDMPLVVALDTNVEHLRETLLKLAAAHSFVW
jgi:small-conductance mechanosensitive channel